MGSRQPVDRRSWAANNTKKLLSELGVNKSAVVGYSMGGMLATRFALMYPETTTHLILENPIGLEDYRLQVPWVSTERIKSRVNQEVAATLSRYPELGRRTAQVIQRAKLIELKDVGHIPHLAAQHKFHAALLGFLDDDG